MKCVFNFGSVRLDLGADNQIVEQCLHHRLQVFEKDYDANLKESKEGQSVGHLASDR